MDIREVPKGRFNRHPWEISRAKKTIEIMSYYLRGHHDGHEELKIVNIGAGDMYFDKEYLRMFPGDKVWAIDVEYKTFNSGHDHIFMAKELDDLSELKFDVAVLMNVMEYIQDEVRFLEELSPYMQPNGMIFIVFPAMQFLYSEHDVYVKGLRRYNHSTTKNIIRNTQGVKSISSFYFYSSLLAVRTIKKFCRIPTDTDQKKVPLWKYSADHIYTKALVGMLNTDFYICNLLSKIGIKLPGLSLFTVCKINR